MRLLKPTILAVTLTMMVSSNAFAGNIAGLRTTGNIAGLRTTGNIAGLRTTGNIGGTRSAGNIGGMRSAGIEPQSSAPVASLGASRLSVETTISDAFTTFIQMLLESGALL